MQPCSQCKALARSTASDRWSSIYTNSSPPKPARRHVSSETDHPLKSNPIPSPPSPPRGKNNSRSTVRNASLGENLGKRRPPRVLALDRARQSCAPGQRTPYDVQITLDAQETTRFKQHPPKWKSDPQAGTPNPQMRWFCARSFKTAVGSRLKDAGASEGLA